MTTQAWSTRWKHIDDATFQEWTQELYDKLIACGLVQTSDTGQLATPVVASMPADFTTAGYWIFRFNDSLQGSAPIFIRVEPGTYFGTPNFYPRLRMRFGTGTDGAGTLTGLFSAASGDNAMIHTVGPATSDTAWESFACHTEGFFGIAFKQGNGGGNGLFLVARSVDGSGTPTAAGAIACWGQGNPSLRVVQCYRFTATAEAYPLQTSSAQGSPCFAPHGRTSSQVGADFQAFVGFTITPQVTPVLGFCGVYASEVGQGSTFSATLVGAAAHTYIGIRSDCGNPTPNTFITITFAMLWE